MARLLLWQRMIRHGIMTAWALFALHKSGKVHLIRVLD
jgi:hypothetical protein